MHTNLARDSHHVHARLIFGIEPERFDATHVSMAAAHYIRRQRAIYEDTSYFAVIGACRYAIYAGEPLELPHIDKIFKLLAPYRLSLSVL